MLKKIINKMPLIKKVLTYVYFYCCNAIFNIKSFCRRHGMGNRYSRLKKLKARYSGERCFIIATGPSLKIEDIQKLKNEYTFSMNSIFLISSKTDWYPTYYGVQDIGLYKSNKEQIDTFCNKNKRMQVLISDFVARKSEVSKQYIQFPLYFSDHWCVKESKHIGFSEDCYDRVHDGFSITYSLIQLAVYMGFQEIYLLGADCNYSGSKTHFDESYKAHIPSDNDLAMNNLFRAYQTAKNYADNHDIKIYNATRGGMLEIFERVNLDEVV